MEVGETSMAALKREMLEETGARVRIERPLWIVENFFRLPDPVHEIGFYFLVTLLDDARMNLGEQFFGYEENRRPARRNTSSIEMMTDASLRGDVTNQAIFFVSH